MKKFTPTFEEFVDEDAKITPREEVANLKDRYVKKTKVKKELSDKLRKEKESKEIEKAEITTAEIDIKNKELDLLKDKANIIKQKEIFRK